MPTVDIVVQGRVQGVGFRAYVARLAATMNLRGEVWNRRDGAVEALACHKDQAVLDDFVKRMRAGPGRIDHVWSDTIELEPEPTGFEIGPSR